MSLPTEVEVHELMNDCDKLNYGRDDLWLYELAEAQEELAMGKYILQTKEILLDAAILAERIP